MKPVLALALSVSAFAATTATWEMTGYQDFLRGRLNGLSLTRDGRLTLGPKLDTVFSSDQPQIWSVAQAADGSLYLGTGNRGRLYKIDPSGKSTLIWTADQPEIFAVALDAKGVVYAATSPDGKVYRIVNGKAAEYFAPAAHYIWALKFAADGSLFVATGDEGKIFRVTSAGHGDLYYETGQEHITCLAIDREGRLLAGSEPNGILYRITAQNKAFVLYDANLPEIRSIVTAPDGSIYAAALGGSIARRTGAAANPAANQGTMVVAPTMSITVTEAQGGLNPNPKPEAPKPVAPVQPAVVAQPATTDYAGVDRSALYKINADNTVETLWTSKEENAYDLVFSGTDLTFITDTQGRIYRLDRDRKATLLAQANEGEATRLIESSNGLLAATGNLGKILRLGLQPGSSGWFESPVHDSGTVARWGRLFWRGDATGVAFKTRTGNSIRPDATWSDWSAPITDLARSNVTSPNARYIQWRAEMSAPAAGLDSVTIAYLPQNTPPVVRSVNVTAQPASGAKASAQPASSTASYSINVTDTGETSSPAGTQSQTVSRAAGSQIQITWQADDPDSDRLIYSLYFRGEDEREWKLLRANITDNTYLLDGDVFADGRYFFRVIASDRPSNPVELAREAELVSAPVLIDNTPPLVTVSAPRRSGSGAEFEVDAEDRGSILRRCEYSIDAGPWSPVEASDGVTDSNRERFNIRLANLSPGEHLVVIRVYDAAGNAGLAKVVIR
ncbi:MAG TPA: hypothetical protein VKR43_14935 [Bryobacteraceae bacterium]|nr:hypothetical protein [Bryobacteraceae bacterium]